MLGRESLECWIFFLKFVCNYFSAPTIYHSLTDIICFLFWAKLRVLWLLLLYSLFSANPENCTAEKKWWHTTVSSSAPCWVCLLWHRVVQFLSMCRAGSRVQRMSGGWEGCRVQLKVESEKNGNSATMLFIPNSGLVLMRTFYGEDLKANWLSKEKEKMEKER